MEFILAGSGSNVNKFVEVWRDFLSGNDDAKFQKRHPVILAFPGSPTHRRNRTYDESGNRESPRLQK